MVVSLPQHFHEGGVVRGLVEEFGSAHGPIEHVVDVTTGGSSQSSRHGRILAGQGICVHPKKAPDPFFFLTDYNDRLLLGLRGMMSEAELHILKGRMYQAVLNKARRGDLYMLPTVGYVK